MKRQAKILATLVLGCSLLLGACGTGPDHAAKRANESGAERTGEAEQERVQLQPGEPVEIPSESNPQADQPIPPAIPPVALPVASIKGSWLVKSVDGQAMPEGKPVILDIGPDRIDFQNCQQVNWGYRLDDTTLAVKRIPAITIDIRPKPQPCAARFPPGADRMVSAIDAVDRVGRWSPSAIRLSGQGRTVDLRPR